MGEVAVSPENCGRGDREGGGEEPHALTECGQVRVWFDPQNRFPWRFQIRSGRVAELPGKRKFIQRLAEAPSNYDILQLPLSVLGYGIGAFQFFYNHQPIRGYSMVAGAVVAIFHRHIRTLPRGRRSEIVGMREHRQHWRG